MPALRCQAVLSSDYTVMEYCYWFSAQVQRICSHSKHCERVSSDLYGCCRCTTHTCQTGLQSGHMTIKMAAAATPISWLFCY